jgi:F1F0 ATPase subunit 2
MTAAAMAMLMGAFSAGLALGSVFFGGLWLTIRYTLASQGAGLWLAGSFLLRTAVVLSGFHMVMSGTWQRLAACLSGFLVARLIAMRTLRPPHTARGPASSGTFHAP